MNKGTDSKRARAGDTVLQNRSKFLHDSDAPISSLNWRLVFHWHQWLSSGYSTLIPQLALRTAEYDEQITINDQETVDADGRRRLPWAR